jgi:hypothetical protein
VNVRAASTSTGTPESRHRVCWYSRRTPDIPSDLGLHTIEDGKLLYCAHPMWLPVVGYQFDVRNCADCEYFKPAARDAIRY